MNTQYDSRTADKFVVRLPAGLRDDVQGAACHLDTSMNTVFVQAVRQYLDSQQRQQLLLDALAKAVTGKEELDAVLHWRDKHTQAIRERDALQLDLNQRDEQIATLESQREAWLRNSQAAERRVEVLEGLLREVVALDPRGEFLGWQLDGKIDAALKRAEGAKCCTISAKDRALLDAGDYTPEELFGIGGKPSCPKCAP